MVKEEDCIKAGKVTKTHGLQGAVVVAADSDLLERYAARVDGVAVACGEGDGRESEDDCGDGGCCDGRYPPCVPLMPLIRNVPAPQRKDVVEVDDVGWLADVA